jgi:hypothetical protein
VRPCPFSFLALSGLLLAGACAQPPAPVEPAVPRVLLSTVAEWPALPALAAAAAQRAGVAVTAASAVSPRLFALTLDCADARACRDAMQRLAADTTFARAVEPDSRRSLPPRPAASARL